MKLSTRIVACALLATLSACALLQSNSAASAAVSVAVEFVTGKYIQGGGSTAADTARAVQIKAIATDIASAATSSSAPAGVAALLTQINTIVAAKNYDPATLGAIDGLLQLLTPELQQLEATPAGAGAGVAVADVMGWIETACSWYGA